MNLFYLPFLLFFPPRGKEGGGKRGERTTNSNLPHLLVVSRFERKQGKEKKGELEWRLGDFGFEGGMYRGSLREGSEGVFHSAGIAIRGVFSRWGLSHLFSQNCVYLEFGLSTWTNSQKHAHKDHWGKKGEY